MAYKIGLKRGRNDVGHIAWNWEDRTQFLIKDLVIVIDDKEASMRSWITRAIFENSEDVMLQGKETPPSLEHYADGVLTVLDLAMQRYKGLRAVIPPLPRPTNLGP